MEWYHNLRTVRQNQFHEFEQTSTVLGALRKELIGDGTIIDKKKKTQTRVSLGEMLLSKNHKLRKTLSKNEQKILSSH